MFRGVKKAAKKKKHTHTHLLAQLVLKLVLKVGFLTKKGIFRGT